MSLQEIRDTAPRREVPRYHPHQPVGGSIIDAQGKEIPITEDMIQRACRELENSCVQRSR
ncbi:PA1571 family protein [Pseudomonas panipatensis]|uniref:Multifunctional fatty acid oxidation complex subunit alpha n=1 Tax=Pseudomonas panipatensis TaxID=428992 RepID=A0A1G8IJZ2_9PSED|nr:PA1571 family protein [Pseudomonas panipatensis]SDI19276.1 hypothetical protein SAMN05216272_106306 [Pseudomonas panipatensis]SMP73714.1 hypothetical protein SAMN06295951_11262 [Pseudomonas panipatensis]